MKKITLLSLMLFSLLCMNMLQAQVNIGGNPVSFTYEKSGILEPLIFDEMPPLNMSVVEAEDAQWEAERLTGMIKIGRRFGIEFEVDYAFDNSGKWTYLPNGGKLWRLGIECPEALSINLIFDQYRLPAGATLYIYSADKRDKIGGFTEYNNQADNFFATDVVLSDKVIIEYYQPANADFDGELRLATIVHGYRTPSTFTKAFGDSKSCQRNTICPEGEPWQDQIRSVFGFYSGGWEVCSGAIVNNTTNDGTPYALTANHCWDAYRNPGIWVFRFNWESPTCTPTTNSGYQTMSGSVLRMRTSSSTSGTDACLVELNQPIPDGYGVFYAGWSRSTTAPTSGMCIHHPELDIKKITFSQSISATTQYVQGWRANWPTQSCTEGGSSGSPLFDHNGRIIGQEYGGPACSCSSSSNYDVYGRLNISWNGTAASNRLKDWLDPLNLDPETWNGRYNQEVAECEPVRNITLERSLSEITITWEAPENIGVQGYTVFVNGNNMGTCTDTYFVLATIDVLDDDYEFCVIARYNYEWCEAEPVCVFSPFSVGEMQANPIKIYPNPANSHIFVEGEHIETVEIYNLQGRLLHTQKGNVRKIEVSGFAAGTYWVKVSMENGQQVTKQITISRF